MMTNFLRSSVGKAIVVLVGVVSLGTVGYEFYRMAGASDSARALNTRWFVCTETRKAFQVELSDVREIPTASPFSGKKTGVPAELCYWTADGKVDAKPTPVLLNQYVGDSSPTFCPVCGRLVVERNPPAIEGQMPPPTKAEYEARHHMALGK